MNADRVFKLAKGFYGRAKNCWRIAKPRVEKALQHAYRGRRLKKRMMRKLWIAQINAATRQYGLIYSQFIHAMVRNNIALNRKMMAELAITEPYSFWALVTRAQESGPWRDWRAQRQTAVPQRFVFLPYPWSVVKQHLQHMVDAQARIAQKEAQMPEIFRERFFKLFAAPIKKAEEQNKKDIAAGKIKLTKPVYFMNKAERLAYFKEKWAAATKKLEAHKAVLQQRRIKKEAAERNILESFRQQLQQAEALEAANPKEPHHNPTFKFARDVNKA